MGGKDEPNAKAITACLKVIDMIEDAVAKSNLTCRKGKESRMLPGSHLYVYTKNKCPDWEAEVRIDPRPTSCSASFHCGGAKQPLTGL